MSQPRREMRTLIALLMVVVMFSLLGCNNDAPPARKPEPCLKTVEYTVYGRNENVLYRRVVQAELAFGDGQRRPNNNGLLYPMIPDQSFSDARNEVNKSVTEANQNLAQFFGGPPVTSIGGFDYQLEIGYSGLDGLAEDLKQACQPSSHSVWFGSGLKFYTGDSGYRYRTYTNFVGETVYVTSVHHTTGSKVTYSFPAAWYDRAVSGPFEDVSAFILPTAPELQHETAAGAELAEETLLAAIAGDLHEVSYFSFASDDYEGRKELRPVIVKAMELEYARSGANAFLFTGRTATNTRVFARATFSGSNFQLSGWQALSLGEMEGRSTGGSAESSFSINTSQVLEGSIYVLPSEE